MLNDRKKFKSIIFLTSYNAANRLLEYGNLKGHLIIFGSYLEEFYNFLSEKNNCIILSEKNSKREIGLLYKKNF